MYKVGFIGGKFLPLHNGHVYAIVQASNQCEKLYVVLSHGEERERHLCGTNDHSFKYIEPRIRLRWLKQLTKDMENVEVIDIVENVYTDSAETWRDGSNQIKKQIIERHIDAVFSSEPSYTSIFEELYPGTEHIILDKDRDKYFISGTMLREHSSSIYKHWNMIPDVVKPHYVKKVVVVGTESCGKSTLIRNLAKLYNTNYVEEYGRTICEEYGGYQGIFTEDLFQQIIYGHKVREYEAIKTANKVVFIDTEAIVTEYYLKIDFPSADNTIYREVAKLQDYDLVLYLEPDVDWIDDGLRILGEDKVRKSYNKMLKSMLTEAGTKFTVISGDYQERLMQSMKHIDILLD